MAMVAYAAPSSWLVVRAVEPRPQASEFLTWDKYAAIRTVIKNLNRFEDDRNGKKPSGTTCRFMPKRNEPARRRVDLAMGRGTGIAHSEKLEESPAGKR